MNYGCLATVLGHLDANDFIVAATKAHQGGKKISVYSRAGSQRWSDLIRAGNGECMTGSWDRGVLPHVAAVLRGHVLKSGSWQKDK